MIGRGSWDPIVPLDRFNALIAVMKDPKRRTSPGAQPRWLLSGIAACEICGLPVTSWRAGYDKNRNPKVGYRCTVPRPATENHATAPAQLADDYVTDRLLAGYLETGFGFVVPTATSGVPDTDTDDLDTRRQETISLFEDGLLTADEYRASLARLQLRTEQQNPPAVQVTAPPGADSLDDLRAEWKALDIDRKRQIVRDTVDVTIRRTGAGLRVDISERVGLWFKFHTFAAK